MIKALIVDDEKLIRKGLITVFPWAQFDISIVGESSNGKNALEFMRKNEVDLVFVDLTMPVMTGFELMKKIRSEFPEASVVILTCHQDFSYVQESLRMGAIDYIVKTQLDKDSIDDILYRITKRMEDDSIRSSRQTTIERIDNSINGGLMVSVAQQIEKEEKPQLELNRTQWFELANGMWFSHQMNQSESYKVVHDFLSSTDRWVYIDVCDLNPRMLPAVLETLRQEVPVFLFYEYTPGKRFYQFSYQSFLYQAPAEQSLSQLESEWFNLQWIRSEMQFQKMLDLTIKAKPGVKIILQWAHQAISPWAAAIVKDKAESLLKETGLLCNWYQWVNWLCDFRSLVSSQFQKLNCSAEVALSIMKSLLYITKAETFNFSRDDLAEKFNMSPSYFSQCFKEITGSAFGDYLKEMKLIRSKVLLEQSDAPIYLIAERSGFYDEKYFSKIFRDYVGINPTEYRKERAKGDKEILENELT